MFGFKKLQKRLDGVQQRLDGVQQDLYKQIARLRCGQSARGHVWNFAYTRQGSTKSADGINWTFTYLEKGYCFKCRFCDEELWRTKSNLTKEQKQLLTLLKEEF